jgi:hypothetical protein
MRRGFKKDVTLLLLCKYNLNEEKILCDAKEQTLRMTSRLKMTSHCCYCASTDLKEEKVTCDAKEHTLRIRRRGF